MILPCVDVDPYAASRCGMEYTVRSLYLDTRTLDFYHEKLAGIKERKKIRIRGYNEITPETPIFLEIKRKTGLGATKRRSMVRYRDLCGFLEAGDARQSVLPIPGREEAVTNAEQFLFHVRSQALVPVISIVYEREAYFSKFDRGVRVTFDKNLRSHNDASLDSLARELPEIPALPHRFVLEIKTDNMVPAWLASVVTRFGVNRDAASKYTLGIDALDAAGYRLDLIHRWTAP